MVFLIDKHNTSKFTYKPKLIENKPIVKEELKTTSITNIAEPLTPQYGNGVINSSKQNLKEKIKAVELYNPETKLRKFINLKL